MAMRWLLRIGALILFVTGLVLVTRPEPASTAQTSGELRGWALVILGAVYFLLDYRLKLRADRRAERAEARDIQDRKREMDDLA